MCLLPPKLFSAKKQPFRQSRGSFVQYTNLPKWLRCNYEWVFWFKKSSFQEAVKRKLFLTNLNQLQKVLKKKKNTQQEKKKWLGTFAIYHSLRNKILPIKVSFDVQNIKEQKIANHWPGGVVLPLTSQACSQEQSLLDRTWWKEKNNGYSLIAKKVHFPVRSTPSQRWMLSRAWNQLHVFFPQRYTTFVRLATCCLNAITWENSRHFAMPPLNKCNLSAEIPYW